MAQPSIFGLQSQKGGDTGQRVDMMLALLDEGAKKSASKANRALRSLDSLFESIAKGSRGGSGGRGRSITPRQILGALHGNLATTGTSFGLGAVAAGVGLAGAASPNGIQPLTQALHLLAASIGGALLPALVNLSAGIMTLADMFNAFRTERDPADSNSLRNAVAIANEEEFGGMIGAMPAKHRAQLRETLHQGAPAAPAGPEPGSWSDMFRKNQELILKTMAAGMSRTGQGSIADAAKKAQEAALGGGVDYKILQVQMQNLQVAQRIARNTENLQVTK